MTPPPLLDISDLTVEFATRRGIVRAVQHVNISVAKGETLGIVGESGSGKSVTSYAVMRILDRAGKIAQGSVVFSGIDVRTASEDQIRDLRGREISMIFQNPRAALNPIRKVGDQIEDVLRQHVQQAQIGDRGEKAIEALEQVKIARPRERYHAYPFELSGGMCQRVVIALALACRRRTLRLSWPGLTRPSINLRKTLLRRWTPGSSPGVTRISHFSWSKSWSRNIRARAPPPCSASCSRASRRSRPNCSARSM